MKSQQFIYVDSHPKELKDDSQYKCLGTIEISDVFYTVEMDGRIQLKLVTTAPGWAKILNDCPEFNAETLCAVLMDTEDVTIGDSFEVFRLAENGITELKEQENEYFNLSAKDDENHLVFRWRLKSRYHRDPEKHPTRTASVVFGPRYCPICGEELDIDETIGDPICPNSNCRIYKYLAITRFLNVACRLPQHQRFGRVLVDHQVIGSTADIFDVLSNKASVLWCYGDPRYVKTFIDDLSAIKGTITLTDWLNSLPTLRHDFYLVEKPLVKICQPAGGVVNLKNYLCTTAINRDFGNDPSKLVHWVDDLFRDVIYADDTTEFADWREAQTKKILKYMSVPVFFSLAEVFNYGNAGEEDYPTTLEKLQRLGVFKTTQE